MKKAVFPGSFDPITLGHEDVITRAIPLFDEIIIAIGINSNKKYMFSLEQRIKFIEECFQEYDNVKVVAYSDILYKLKNMNYILFDGSVRNSLLPFTYTRPATFFPSRV